MAGKATETTPPVATTEVAVKETAGALAVIDFAADSGAGFEEADSSSYAIPFLRMLQATSDQCKKTQPEYIKGSEEGDMLNTVTGKLYKGDDGVVVIPVHYAHKYNLWVPNRGGYRGSWTVSEYEKNQKQKITIQTPNGPIEAEGDMEGNVITDTREHYCIVVEPDGGYNMVLLPMASTQLKKSKKWMTLMSGIRIQGQPAPMFSQMYLINPVGESNDKGSWSGLNITHLKQVDSVELYQAAKNFREMVRSGAAKAAVEEGDIPF
jgi:hypothetical protein